MKAVICALNSKYTHSALAPWCLLAGVRAFAPELEPSVEIAEGTVNQSDEELLHLLSGDADLLAFSCYIWNINTVKRLLPRLQKEKPGLKILLGGPEVSYHAGEVFETMPEVDFLLAGEGEKPFALLLRALARQTDLREVPGLSFRGDTGLFLQEPYVTKEEPPTPYCSAYFERLHGRMVYLETSRGCPFSCSFCLSGRCGGARFFPLERAKRELLLLACTGTKTVKLVDRTFNCSAERTRALCAFLMEEQGKSFPADVCFHFEVEGDLFDRETLTLLAKAPPGLFQMEVGLQSFHPETLSAVHRNPRTEKLCQVISALLTPRNIHLHIDLIAGLPFEDYATFGQSFDKAYALQPDMLQLGFLKLLHGAQLRADAEKDGCVFDPEPPYEIRRGRWLSAEDLTLLHEAEDALERLYNSGRFRRTLQYLFAEKTLSPFCFFSDFGHFMASENPQGMGLDLYIACFFQYLQEKQGLSAEVLRDLLVQDRLATNNTGKLPKALYRADIRLKQAVKAVGERFPLLQSTKRGVALLYGRQAVAFVDYTQKHPVTGEYPLRIIEAQELGISF